MHTQNNHCDLILLNGVVSSFAFPYSHSFDLSLLMVRARMVDRIYSFLLGVIFCLVCF